MRFNTIWPNYHFRTETSRKHILQSSSGRFSDSSSGWDTLGSVSSIGPNERLGGPRPSMSNVLHNVRLNKRRKLLFVTMNFNLVTFRAVKFATLFTWKFISVLSFSLCKDCGKRWACRTGLERSRFGISDSFNLQGGLELRGKREILNAKAQLFIVPNSSEQSSGLVSATENYHENHLRSIEALTQVILRRYGW